LDGTRLKAVTEDAGDTFLPTLRKWKMGQDKKLSITSREGQKRSPASPTSPAQACSSAVKRLLPNRGSLPGKTGKTGETGATPNSPQEPPLRRRTVLPFAPFAPFPPVFGLGRSEVKDMRQPDPITLHRVSKLLAAVRPLVGDEITTTWLASTMVRVDGGPMLDGPRLGPPLRMLGFQSIIPTLRLGDSRGIPESPVT
jgi:hypothetical protein